jgi:hypothetical protein
MFSNVGLGDPARYEFALLATNYSSSALSNIASFLRRSGTVRVNNAPFPMQSTLCNGTVPATQISAFFDQNSNGIVDSFPNIPGYEFPLEPEVHISLPSGYWNQPGNRYATANGLQANLIVVAQFYSCNSATRSHFVAAHIYLEFDDSGRVVSYPVKLLAGDEQNEISLGVEGVLRGVVMNGGMDISMDGAAILDTQPRATGSLFGNVTFGSLLIAYGADIQFEFDVDVQLD